MSHVIKGAVFEVEVSYRLSLIPNSVVLPNLKLYSYFLKDTTEIDRLLICPWKIYCIEAKSFNTELRGSFSDDEWVGASGRYARKLYNPVFQNYEHIRTLNNALRRVGEKPLRMENVVVVPDSCRVETDCDNAMTILQFVDQVLSESYRTHTVDVRQTLLSLSKIKVV